VLNAGLAALVRLGFGAVVTALIRRLALPGTRPHRLTQNREGTKRDRRIIGSGQFEPIVGTTGRDAGAAVREEDPQVAMGRPHRQSAMALGLLRTADVSSRSGVAVWPAMTAWATAPSLRL
jgi:hypothetical protein